MKKHLAIIAACMVFIASLTCIGASCQEINDADGGFAVTFNGEETGCNSIIRNNTHYIPMKKVFEKMGAALFFRSRDSQVMALSRDGDVINHIVGDSIITVNGEQKTFEIPSVFENDEIFIPAQMLSVSLCPDGIFYDNQKMNIQKQIFTNDYNKIVKDVLDVCRSSNFYPEKFQRYINYHVKKPNYTMQEVIYRVNLDFDYPFYENIKTIEHPHELLVMVNKYNRLPAGFNQYNLVTMNGRYAISGQRLSAVAYEKYVQMAEAARKEGLLMKVVSAYRTEDYQRNLYNKRLRTTGKLNADNYTARAGHSEHQTGLAVDINSVKGSFEYTAEFKWLQKHAHEYGFILRYPKGKEWLTGYGYEPWHYRYVGIDAAKIIHEENLTFEQYYAMYISQNEFQAL